MGMTERYLSQIGTYTGDQMKNALYQLLIPRYFWTLWNSESAQKLASSVVNFLFCEPGSGEIARFMAEQQPLIESKARELATDEAVCSTLTCAVYNFSYGRYVDSGGRWESFPHLFLASFEQFRKSRAVGSEPAFSNPSSRKSAVEVLSRF